MKSTKVLVAVVVAVVVCVLAAYFITQINTENPDKDDSSNPFIGTWKLQSYCHGEYDYETDQFNYVSEEKTGDVTIDARTDGFYGIDIFGSNSVGVLQGDVMMTSVVSNNPATLYMTLDNDYMRIAFINKGNCSVSECILVRDGVTPTGEPNFHIGKGTMPEEGTIYDSIKAEYILREEVTSVMDDDYKFEMVANHGSIVFYKVTSNDADNNLFLFSSVEIGNGEWISISPYDGNSMGFLIDMVHITEKVICTASINYSGELSSWYVYYAEKPVEVKAPINFEGMKFDGVEGSIYINEEGVEEKKFENDITIEIKKQFEERLIAHTTFGEGSFNSTAEWFMLVSVHKGYKFCIQSAFEYDGKEFLGLYYGTLGEGGEMLSLGGIAFSSDGSYMVVKQTY